MRSLSEEDTGAERRQACHAYGAGSLLLEGRLRSSTVRRIRRRLTESYEARRDDTACKHSIGTLITNYRVPMTVTLPSVDGFSNFTRCQRQRVRRAIRTILAPDEQQHVAAFRTYNGTTRRRFDLTTCRDDFDSVIRQMFEAEEQAR